MRLFSLTLASAFIFTLSACSTPAPTPEVEEEVTPEAQEETVTETMEEPTSTSSTPSDMISADNLASGKHTVVLKTSMGDISLELDADLAPKTVTNFLVHTNDGYYNDLTFHRVIPGFMIQGGDPSGNGTGGQSIYGATFEDEIDPTHSVYATYKAGTLAMANRGPNTNGSQFFIMEADTPLPPSYTIFGRVTAGQDVVSKIANVDRDGRDMPLSPVTFTPEVK